MSIIAALVIGAIAGWLLPQLHVELASGTLGSIINSTIGAVIILVILSLVRRA